jgi:L-aminopeptidase/D-esterase-like protein
LSRVDLAIPGVCVGHWTDHEARTGCTVVLFPDGTVASGEVRGGAPATREFALLDPLRTVAHLDAVVLTGGSAFGLAAADGVMAVCEEQDRGVATVAGRVPIVVALGLFDLTVGDGRVRPGAHEGRLAAQAALAALAAGSGDCAVGRVGAGTGATIAKWRGREHAKPAGLGGAVLRHDDLVVAALVAVNAVGEIDDGTTSAAVTGGTFDGWPRDVDAPFTNTTIGVVVTNARLDKAACRLLAESGHDGLGRALYPAHTRFDGDALVAAAVGLVDAPLEEVRLLTVSAVESAVRSVA